MNIGGPHEVLPPHGIRPAKTSYAVSRRTLRRTVAARGGGAVVVVNVGSACGLGGAAARGARRVRGAQAAPFG